MIVAVLALFLNSFTTQSFSEAPDVAATVPTVPATGKLTYVEVLSDHYKAIHPGDRWEASLTGKSLVKVELTFPQGTDISKFTPNTILTITIDGVSKSSPLSGFGNTLVITPFGGAARYKDEYLTAEISWSFKKLNFKRTLSCDSSDKYNPNSTKQFYSAPRVYDSTSKAGASQNETGIDFDSVQFDKYVAYMKVAYGNGSKVKWVKDPKHEMANMLSITAAAAGKSLKK